MSKSVALLAWVAVSMLWASFCAWLHLGPRLSGAGGFFVGAAVTLITLGIAVARAERS